jgi:hypothetical protein
MPPELAVHARDRRGREGGEDLTLRGVLALRHGDRLEHLQRAAVATGGRQAHAEQPPGSGGLGNQPLVGRQRSGPAERFDSGGGTPVEGGALTGGEQPGEILGHAFPSLLGRTTSTLRR